MIAIASSPRSFLLPAILWIGAFICSVYPVNAWQLQFFAGALILMFSWSYVMLARQIETGWDIPRAPVLMFAGAFWLLVVLSAFWSEIKPVTLTGICFFSVMPLTFLIGTMAGNESYFKMLVKPLAVLFGVMSIWAIIQFFFLNEYFNGQARHPLADPSSLGALFSLALFCTLGWILADRPKGEHRIAIGLSLLLICGIMSTVARGPIFAFVPGIILFILLLWPQVKARGKSFAILILAVVAFYGLSASGVQTELKLADRVTNTIALEPQHLTNDRELIWASAVEIIKAHPILGTGIGTFFTYYPEYRSPEEKDGVFLVHNDPLQFWVELGVMGPLLFYGFILAAALRTFAALKNLKEGQATERIIVVSIFAALASMVVHSHVAFNHYNLSILMLTGLLLSVWFHVTGRAIGETARVASMPANSPPGLNKALIALPFLMMAWLQLSIMGGEYYANRARDDLFREDLDGFAKHINMANRVSQGLNFRAYMFAVNVPMTILDYRKDMLNDEQQRKLYDQVIGYMNNILAINPRSATAYFYLGKVQSQVRPSVLPAGVTPADEYYKTALRYDPLHLGARLALYNLYKEQGKSFDELLAVMEPGMAYNYTTPLAGDYYGAMGTLYLESRNYGKIRDVAEKAQDFQARSAYSLKRQNTSIPQAIMGDGELNTPATGAPSIPEAAPPSPPAK